MTRNPSTRLGRWLHDRATAERVDTFEGEPEWLPEDRDVVDVYLDEQKSRNACGHYVWEEDTVEGLEPGYRVCPLCAEMGPYAEKIREQNRKRGKDEHGLTFGWFAPREEESDGD
ncbi:MAG: hypothetical protein ACLFVZ_08435 [Actinomycetota bacterium]